MGSDGVGRGAVEAEGGPRGGSKAEEGAKGGISGWGDEGSCIASKRP